VSMHVDTVKDSDTEYTDDAEGKAASTAAFAAPSSAGAHAQVGSCTTQRPAIPAGLCKIICVTV